MWACNCSLVSCLDYSLVTAVFRVCGKMPERREVLIICRRSCWQNMKAAAGGFQVSHNFFQCFVADRSDYTVLIKLVLSGRNPEPIPDMEELTACLIV